MTMLDRRRVRAAMRTSIKAFHGPGWADPWLLSRPRSFKICRFPVRSIARASIATMRFSAARESYIKASPRRVQMALTSSVIPVRFNGLLVRAQTDTGHYCNETIICLKPLSYYTKSHTWELSPGYEGNDIGFSRTIEAGCISSQSGRAYPADANTGRYTPTPFSETAIGCENCHGPGAKHLRAVGPGGSLAHGPQIVNPGRLSSELENDICMSCHEAGDTRVLKPGKTYQDFRPGTPLDNTFSILMVPLKRGDADDKDHVQHYFEMSMSKCFRASDWQLRCATCHDPHVEPAQSEAPGYFNTKCVGCHSSRACTLPLPARPQTKSADNCIGWHQPPRAG